MIIIDRGYDPVAPIIHELTYQAMVNDLLEMDGDVIRYTTTNDQGQEQLKEVILGKSKMVFSLDGENQRNLSSLSRKRYFLTI